MTHSVLGDCWLATGIGGFGLGPGGAQAPQIFLPRPSIFNWFCSNFA